MSLNFKQNYMLLISSQKTNIPLYNKIWFIFIRCIRCVYKDH